MGSLAARGITCGLWSPLRLRQVRRRGRLGQTSLATAGSGQKQSLSEASHHIR